MQKTYDLLLDGQKIGTTLLEHSDAPMGVVFGNILFTEPPASPYQLFKGYCLMHDVEITYDYAETKLIQTRHIPGLKVISPERKSIEGHATYIAGMDGEPFEIYIEAIPYPFFEEEFPHHVSAYNNLQ